MRGREYPEIGERLYRSRLASGLTVAAVPKPGFQGWAVTLRAPFGSAGVRFRTDAGTVSVPGGTAEMLAAVLSGGDAASKLEYAGSPVRVTVAPYWTEFSACGTGDAAEAARLLLDTVSAPIPDADLVRSLRKALGSLRRRSPSAAAEDGLRALLFAGHPAGTPLSETEKDLAAVRREDLEALCGAFCRASCLTLCAAGKIDPELLSAAASSWVPPYRGEKPVAVRPPATPLEPETPRGETLLPAAERVFALGARYAPAESGAASLRKALVCGVTLRLLLDEAGGAGSSVLRDCGVVSGLRSAVHVSGETPWFSVRGAGGEPAAVCARVADAAADLAARGPERDALDRALRRETGAFLMSLDSPELLCSALGESCAGGWDPFSAAGVLQSIQSDEIRQFAGDAITARRLAVSVVKNSE